MLDERFITGKEVIEKLENHGFQAYFVGGCVRDLLLNKEIKDIDIASSAFPETVMSIFDKVIPLGVEHGTVLVRHKSISFEITTFRLDGEYSDYRHPDQVQFINNIELDLQRRDFTINALAMNKDGKIIDLFNGQADLNNHLIKTVGKGELRFKEDPLRIIRALRFSSQLGFSIDHETFLAMKKIKKDIKNIAVERITVEMTKLIAGNSINDGMRWLIESEIYYYLPIIDEHPHLIHQLPSNLKPMNSFAELVALFHHIDPSITINKWIKQWKCSNKTKNMTINLVKSLNDFANNGLNRWLVYELKEELYDSFINLVEMLFERPVDLNKFNQISRELPIHSKKDLAINGTTLMLMFPNKKKGPWIKQILDCIEKKVVMNKLENKHDSLKEWVKWHPPEMN